MSFISLLGFHSGNYTTFFCPISLEVPRLDCSSDFFWFVFDNPDSFVEYWSGVLWNVPQLGFNLICSNGETMVMGFGGKTAKVKCPLMRSCHSKDACYPHDSLMLTTIFWPRLCLPVFSTVKELSPCTFHTLLFGVKSQSTAHTQGTRK